MAHLANTTSVQTKITAASLAPINTQRIPNVIPTLPPGYHALNALLNPPNPTPLQTPAGSPGGPLFLGHPIPGFIPMLPQFPSGNPNPSGTIPTVAPNPQIPLVDRVVRFLFLFPDTTQLLRNLRLAHNFQVELYLQIGGPTSPFGQNIPPELAQYWNQLLQNFPQNVGGRKTVPTSWPTLSGSN
jgi:hypothetical protein